MIGRHTPLSRRTILRGAGASLALPWLEAMMPASASAAARPPVRMAILYMANGTREDMWTPQGTGRDFELSPTLQQKVQPQRRWSGLHNARHCPRTHTSPQPQLWLQSAG